jgi:DNA-binding MarR family transcriptional regulator
MRDHSALDLEPASLSLLMNSVVSRLSREAVKDLAELGLNVQSARILILLLEKDRLRCSAIAMFVGLEATALSHLLRALADQGLVIRERVKEDNRAVEVRLTPKGRQLARSCREVDIENQRVLFDGFQGDELERFTDYLARMSDNLKNLRQRAPRD